MKGIKEKKLYVVEIIYVYGNCVNQLDEEVQKNSIRRQRKSSHV